MKQILYSVLIILNITLYLCVFALWIIIPDSYTLNISTTIFTICMTFALALKHRAQIRAYVSSEHFENFANAVIQCVLVFSILGLVNYLAFKRPLQWDVSKNQLNSISEQSINITKKIKSPMVFKVFASNSQKMSIVPLIDLYRFVNHNIKIEIIDPTTNPHLANQYNVTDDGIVVVEFDGKTKRFKNHSEKMITKTILDLTSKKPKKILFTSNHSELKLSQNDMKGVSKLKEKLKNSFYEVTQSELLGIKKLNSFDSVVILGPKQKFLEKEISILEKYLEKGGRVLLALNPEHKIDLFTPLLKLAKKWGIEFTNSIIVDNKSYVNGSNGLVPIIKNYNSKHPATKDFSSAIFFPLASALKIIEMSDIKLTPLAYTNLYPHSYGEQSFEQIANGKYRYDIKGDMKGPLNVGVSAEKNIKSIGKTSKLIFLGNSTFLANSYASHGGNQSFFMNLLSWLMDDDFKIANTNSLVSRNPVIMSQNHINMMFYFSVLFCPILLFGIAIFTFIKRQN